MKTAFAHLFFVLTYAFLGCRRLPSGSHLDCGSVRTLPLAQKEAALLPFYDSPFCLSAAEETQLVVEFHIIIRPIRSSLYLPFFMLFAASLGRFRSPYEAGAALLAFQQLRCDDAVKISFHLTFIYVTLLTLRSDSGRLRISAALALRTAARCGDNLLKSTKSTAAAVRNFP